MDEWLTLPRIRGAVAADIEGLVRLEEAAFPGNRLTRREFRDAIRSPSTVTLVAREADGLAGYVFMSTRRRSRVARITSVAVDAKFAGQGHGRRLVEAAEAAAREAGCDRVRLEVRADNARAARLYEQAGYRAYDTVGDYYDDGETAHCYEKDLARVG